MVSLLAKIFVKNNGEYQNPTVRRGYGTLCSLVGICFNVLMFVGKYIAGSVANSISITADAFNNLSDAGSSVIALVGFIFSGKEPDLDHPFGHGRIEYISGLGVSVAIIVMGLELFKSSFTKIFRPEPIAFGVLPILIMVGSILIKMYMAFYNSRIGEKIDSAAMKSVAADSISDTISTFVVLGTTIASRFTHANIDAYAGVFVAVLILITGFKSAKETISPLLGKAPNKEFVKNVEDIVMSQEHIVGIHDLIVHDYGPGRLFVSLHAEVPGNEDIFLIHDEVDNAERELGEHLHCHAVIHMDPVCTDNEEVTRLKDQVTGIVKSIDPVLTIHDFRIVPGNTHTNLVFDAVVPSKYKMSNKEVNDMLKQSIEARCENCFAVITVEQSYI